MYCAADSDVVYPSTSFSVPRWQEICDPPREGRQEPTPRGPGESTSVAAGTSETKGTTETFINDDSAGIEDSCQ